MQQILFASSNQSKLEQFQYVADAHDLKVKIISVYHKLPGIKPYNEEYQTQFEIVENGTHEIYAQTKQPIVVEDTILEVDALGGLPGLHASDFLKEKGRAGLLQDLHGQANRAACITSIAGYFDGKLFISSKNVVEGRIAEEESYKDGEPTWVGPSHHPLGGGFNSIFIVNASGRTLADHSAQEGLMYGYREPNFKAMLDILA
jgi:non-canonical purine NTP pyrophosphatase (RdgB/HAM1 family)